ncbi:MAG: aldolase/citrate lyase family protein [Gammaproteobacteria bacterium]|nr:aldolase/citrate lyase family protein [Gammaproteobacteria bacterium]MDE0257025.1 aldolase/citrate lyase family protein [Gammaproteobacteria bacterium]
MRPLRPSSGSRGLSATLLLAIAAAVASCAPSGDAPGTQEQTAASATGANPMVDLLATGQPVFGIFSGEHTPGQGARMARNREVDFVFYSLESGPFDIPAMEAYMGGMREGAGEYAPQPVALRIPPIRDGADSARVRARAGLDAGAHSIVYPHVESVEEAELAVGALGDAGWPGNPDGNLVNILLIEDRVGIERAAEIVRTPGVSVVIPGPGDLRRAYEGDMEAVEAAIQTVLAECLAAGVACGITAGPDDIGERLDQGFRFFIVTSPEALAVGRAHAGRAEAEVARATSTIGLWERNLAAFGVFVPPEFAGGGGPGAAAAPGAGPGAEPGAGPGARGQRGPPRYTVEGGRELARNPLLDFVFLNLERSYDPAAVEAIATGLRSPGAVGRKTLLVRIPSIEQDGEEATRARVREALELGADGVVLPHVRNVAEARAAVSFFEDTGADVWSPANPDGTVIAMLMVEDPDAVAEAAAIADVPGYSVLACGIGSLTGALGGDREAAEQGNQAVLAEATRAGLADMITANAGDIGQRVGEGFLGLLMQVGGAEEAIRLGRQAAGR